MPIHPSHFVFLEADRKLEDAMSIEYDPLLIGLSVLVACVASYTAFLISERISASEARWQRLVWGVIGAACMGVGIWAMHFTGMLAYRLPVNVGYDRNITLLSVLPAMLASGIVLLTHVKKIQPYWHLPVQSVLMGAGIGLVHYVGMAAMRMDAVMRYDPWMFALSLVVAVGLSYVSLKLKLWAESEEVLAVPEIRAMLIAAVMMGCAISAMHYTGMAAVYHFPLWVDVSYSVTAGVWQPESIADLLVYAVLAMLMLMIVAVHLSRRMELLRRLQDSETRQANIVNHMVDGLIVINERGIIDAFNPAAEKIFGYRMREVLGKNVGILMAESEGDRHDRHLERYQQSRKSNVIGIGRDVEGRRKDGRLFPMDIALSRLQVDGKQFFSAVVRDITDRKEAEKKLLEAKQSAEQASRAKSDFLARVSHELRTPMNAILGFSQVLEAEAASFNKEQHGYIEEIQTAGYRLLELIDGMLDLSRLETNNIKVQMDAVALNDMLRACLSQVAGQAREKQIEMTNLADGNEYIVSADPERLQQVLLHLLSNAIKHNKQGGRVSLGCEEVGAERLRISVTDTGYGMTQQQLQELYRPFGRLNRDERRSGTGIGLALSKHLIELMGGQIGVESQEGVGSTFWIEVVRAMTGKLPEARRPAGH